MIQVYSLPNLEVKDHKNEKEWFLYQNNGISLLRQLRNADVVSVGWEVIKSSPSDPSQPSPEYAVSESLSPTVQSPTEQSPGSDDSTTKSGISAIGNN